MNKITQIICLLGLTTILQGQVIVDLTDCHDNCIWTTFNSTIKSWEIDGQTPIYKGDFVSGRLGEFAIGHIPISPDTTLNTFVTCTGGNNGLSYWNGSNWVSFAYTLPTFTAGLGGFKNDFYFILRGNSDGIFHFDGENAPTLISSYYNQIADIAVDDLGRAWFFSGVGRMDTLICMNRFGNIINRFPLSISISGLNAYGALMKKDTIFVGFGHGNPDFQSQIVSIVVKNNIADVGDRVVQCIYPVHSFVDLASKIPGNPLNPPVNTLDFSNPSISIFPNPTNKFLIVEQPVEQPIELLIYNMQGILLKKNTTTSTQTKLRIEDYPPGVYLMMIKQDANVIKLQKWIKID